MIHLPKKNGISYYGSDIYKCWGAIKQRCNNSNNPRYKNYGGKGIKICEHWSKFENFLVDMGDRPKDKVLLRLVNNDNYYKENCRWGTTKELARRRSTTIFIKYKGKKYCLKDLSKKIKVSPPTIKKRYKLGGDLTKKIPRKFPRKLLELDEFVFCKERDINIKNLRKFGCTLHHIGTLYGLTRERIRQIINNK